MKKTMRLKVVGIVVLVPLLILAGSLVILDNSRPAQAASTEDGISETLHSVGLQAGVCDCAENSLDCSDFSSQQEAQACYDYCQETVGSDIHRLDGLDFDGLVCESLPDDPSFSQTEDNSSSPQDQTTLEPDEPEVVTLDTITLIRNGNFEFGFYHVPELGFEPPDSGDVPIDFGWYKNRAYGKYTIRNNQGFGLQCPLDAAVAAELAERRAEEEATSGFGPVPGYVPLPAANALELHMQSTDEQDARIGVYQIVDVVPGQDYRFAMSGTIQIQSGAKTLQPDDPVAPEEAQNHTIELSFDHNAGTDWQAIPLEKRTIVEWPEQKLEFKISEDDTDIAEIFDFETTVRARSDKMTVFITAWRKWANWRTTRFIIDCVVLTPLSLAGVPPSVQQTVVVDSSTPAETPTDVPSDDAQPASITEPAETEAETPSEETPANIPSAGGILEDTGNSVLIIIASAIVILGLVGAGIWNMRR